MVAEQNPGNMALRTRSSGMALFVVSEVCYLGWQAEVNGQPAPVVPIGHALRGVVARSGDSTVRLRYAPASVRNGFALASLPVLIAFLVAIRYGPWRRSQALPS